MVRHDKVTSPLIFVPIRAFSWAIRPADFVFPSAHPRQQTSDAFDGWGFHEMQFDRPVQFAREGAQGEGGGNAV